MVPQLEGRLRRLALRHILPPCRLSAGASALRGEGGVECSFSTYMCSFHTDFIPSFLRSSWMRTCWTATKFATQPARSVMSVMDTCALAGRALLAHHHAITLERNTRMWCHRRPGNAPARVDHPRCGVTDAQAMLSLGSSIREMVSQALRQCSPVSHKSGEEPSYRRSGPRARCGHAGTQCAPHLVPKL